MDETNWPFSFLLSSSSHLSKHSLQRPTESAGVSFVIGYTLREGKRGRRKRGRVMEKGNKGKGMESSDVKTAALGRSLEGEVLL